MATVSSVELEEPSILNRDDLRLPISALITDKGSLASISKEFGIDDDDDDDEAVALELEGGGVRTEWADSVAAAQADWFRFAPVVAVNAPAEGVIVRDGALVLSRSPRGRSF